MPMKCLAVMTVMDGPGLTARAVKSIQGYLQQLASDLACNPLLLDGTRWIARPMEGVSITFNRAAKKRHSDQLAEWLLLGAADLKKDRKQYAKRFTRRYFVK